MNIDRVVSCLFIYCLLKQWPSTKGFLAAMCRARLDNSPLYWSNTIFQCFLSFFFSLSFQVEKRLKELDGAENTDDLLKCFKNYGDDLMKLAKLSGIRQAVSKILLSSNIQLQQISAIYVIFSLFSLVLYCTRF